MARYKSNVQKVTILPNGITLVPNQELEVEVDMTPYEKVGYVTCLDKKQENKEEVKEEKKQEEKPARGKRGRAAGKAE